MRRLAATALLALALIAPAATSAHPLDPATVQRGSYPPPNDLTPLPALDVGQVMAPAEVQLNHDDPPLEPPPRAHCRGGSHPLHGMQGRVPASAIDSPEAARGWTCNLRVVGRNPTPGGWKVWRYVDEQGNTCAFYDTSLAYPLNVVKVVAGLSPGVAVLDMSDPAHPRQTTTLTAPAMLAPHESLSLSRRRGLLAAVMGNGFTAPALMSVYDVSDDCRQPVHLATTLPTPFGHEGSFSRDGLTYWIGGGIGIAAVDLTDPANPRTVWTGNVYAHGLSLSRDGNRLYDADPINGQLAILDVTEVQAREPTPTVQEISRLTWNGVSVPQNTAPMTIDDHSYLLEVDEFAFRFSRLHPLHRVGGARIIDISDERRPRIVSHLRLRVNQRHEHTVATESDPLPPLPGPTFAYTAHYCSIPREIDPEIVACSFTNSGLRIFNVEDPRRPREVAYFIAPPQAPSSGGGAATNFALSKPAFDRSRRQLWYSDGNSGFYSLKLPKRVWPQD